MSEFPHSDGWCEGNNGGDYIRLRHIEGDKFQLDIGHQCVVVFNLTGTPSEIAEKVLDLVCNQKGESG